VTALLAASRRLSAASTQDETAQALADQTSAASGGRAVVLLPHEGELVQSAGAPATALLTTAAMAAARWAWEKGEAAGSGTGTLPQVGWTFWPLVGLRGRAGVAGAEFNDRAGPDEISWVQTGYLMAELVMIPFSAFLAQARGLRNHGKPVAPDNVDDARKVRTEVHSPRVREDGGHFGGKVRMQIVELHVGIPTAPGSTIGMISALGGVSHGFLNGLPRCHGRHLKSSCSSPGRRSDVLQA